MMCGCGPIISSILASTLMLTWYSLLFGSLAYLRTVVWFSVPIRLWPWDIIFVTPYGRYLEGLDISLVIEWMLVTSPKSGVLLCWGEFSVV